MNQRPSLITAKDFPPLSKYRCRAELDWVKIGIVTQSSTNFHTVQRALGAAFGDGKTRSVAALNPNPGGGATEFEITLQDPPRGGRLLGVFNDLAGRIPLISRPTVIAVEVSVDFYSRAKQPEELQQMVLRLKREFAHVDKSARQYSGYKTQFMSKEDVKMDWWSTLYVGNKSDPCFWRIYLKNRDNDVQIADSSLHRARIEVNLSGHMLEEFATLESLSRVRFEALAKLFKCRTCIVPPISETDCKTFPEHLEKIGVNWRLREWWAGQLKLEVPRRRKYSPSSKADTELNTLIRGSLRSLSQRFSAEKRGGIRPKFMTRSPLGGRQQATLITTLTVSPSTRTSVTVANLHGSAPSSPPAVLQTTKVATESTHRESLL